MIAKAIATTPYQQLLVGFTPRTIRSEPQYQRVLRQIDRLMRKPKLTRAEDDLLELLSSLVVQYEQTRSPEPDVSPGQVFEHLVEARGVTKSDVARATGIPLRTINQVVNGSLGFSATDCTLLAKFFHVSPDLFLATE